MKRIMPLPLCLAAALSASCVTMSDYNFRNIDATLSNGDFEAARNELESNAPSIYSPADKALVNLDRGIVSHYAASYSQSNRELSEAESLMRQYGALSVSQAAASVLVNDTVIDYSGDPYEDIYTNIFMALNYLALGKFDDAFVEIRRFDIKLKEITSKYQAALEAQKKTLAANARSVPSSELKFHNSALARYLSMLIYRTEGRTDSAGIDCKKITEAFSLQPSLYPFSVPASVADELSVPKEKARLNVIAFTGLAPVKIEETIPLFALDGFYKIALPVMQRRESAIHGVAVRAQNRESGEVFSANLEKLESIEAIAQETYAHKYALIVAKTVGRMVAKLSVSTAFDVAASYSDEYSSVLSLAFKVSGIISRAATFATERADVRVSRYFPASAFVTGLTVPPGEYDVTVSFVGKNGRTIKAKRFSQEASANALNLMEAVCLQ